MTSAEHPAAVAERSGPGRNRWYLARLGRGRGPAAAAAGTAEARRAGARTGTGETADGSSRNSPSHGGLGGGGERRWDEDAPLVGRGVSLSSTAFQCVRSIASPALPLLDSAFTRQPFPALQLGIVYSRNPANSPHHSLVLAVLCHPERGSRLQNILIHLLPLCADPSNATPT